MTATAPPAPHRTRLLLRIGLVVLALGALLVAGRQLGAWLPAFATWVEGLGAWGPVAFVVGYALAVVAFAPGSVLTLAAGALFGLAKGTVLVFLAATLGASRPWAWA